MSCEVVELKQSMEWHNGVAQYIGYSIKHIIEGENQSIGLMLNDYGARINEANKNSSIDEFMRWQSLLSWCYHMLIQQNFTSLQSKTIPIIFN